MSCKIFTTLWKSYKTIPLQNNYYGHSLVHARFSVLRVSTFNFDYFKLWICINNILISCIGTATLQIVVKHYQFVAIETRGSLAGWCSEWGEDTTKHDFWFNVRSESRFNHTLDSLKIFMHECTTWTLLLLFFLWFSRNNNYIYLYRRLNDL